MITAMFERGAREKNKRREEQESIEQSGEHFCLTIGNQEGYVLNYTKCADRDGLSNSGKH